MSIKPNISYTYKKTENSITRLKKDAKSNSIIYTPLNLPIIISLGTYIKKKGDANFFSPYLRIDNEMAYEKIKETQAMATLSIIAFNLSFLKEENLLLNESNYYNKELRSQIKDHIYGIDNKFGKFACEYEQFKTQILNVIKSNILFIIPDVNTLAYKVYIKTFKENAFTKHNDNIYNFLNKESKIKCEKLFIKLATFYYKLLNNEIDLTPLFKDIQILINAEVSKEPN